MKLFYFKTMTDKVTENGYYIVSDCVKLATLEVEKDLMVGEFILGIEFLHGDIKVITD